MELGQEDVKKTLLKLGMKGIDAERLIKSAEKKQYKRKLAVLQKYAGAIYGEFLDYGCVFYIYFWNE